jgi:hypothetical protein
MRSLICTLLFKAHLTPSILTSGFLAQFNGIDLFTREFMLGLIPGNPNPFTSAILAQLNEEFLTGNAILDDAGIHIILGEFEPALEDVLRELSLIAPFVI